MCFAILKSLEDELEVLHLIVSYWKQHSGWAQ